MYPSSLRFIDQLDKLLIIHLLIRDIFSIMKQRIIGYRRRSILRFFPTRKPDCLKQNPHLLSSIFQNRNILCIKRALMRIIQIPPPAPCTVCMGMPALQRSSISRLMVLLETSNRAASFGAVTFSSYRSTDNIPISLSIFISSHSISLVGNCETASDCHESVQNEQMAAQNRFEFASYLFILPDSGHEIGVSQLSTSISYQTYICLSCLLYQKNFVRKYIDGDYLMPDI